MLYKIFNLQSKINISINIITTSRINDNIKRLFNGFQSLEIHAKDDDI